MKTNININNIEYELDVTEAINKGLLKKKLDQRIIVGGVYGVGNGRSFILGKLNAHMGLDGEYFILGYNNLSGLSFNCSFMDQNELWNYLIKNEFEYMGTIPDMDKMELNRE
mgnify:CR=1 FL=1